MARKSTIKLLVVNESDNEAERLVSLFRNAGRVARVNRIVSAEDLYTSLEAADSDLLIINSKHPEISIEQCLEQWHKHQADIPILVLLDNNGDIQSALDGGACDVIDPEDDQRLIFAAFRELENLERRRELSTLKEKLADSEARSELLMAQSQDAIAYIADGMIINTNPLFADLFGYESAEDMDCAAIIDLIAEADHEKFKGLLKTQASNSEGSTNFTFTGIKQDGEEISTAMQLSNATLDDEACIQITIRDDFATQASGGRSSNADIDQTTGLYSHHYFLDQLDSYAKQANAGTSNSTLLFISIDRFYGLRSKYGITMSEAILVDIAKYIQSLTEDKNCLAHYCDDAFTMLLPEVSAEKALDFANTLCHSLEQHIIENEGQSIQCTASIGLVSLDQQSSEDPTLLIEEAFSACDSIRTEADNEGVGNGAAMYIPTRKRQSLGNAQSDEDLDKALDEALEDGRFSLSFNPIVSLKGNVGDYYEVNTLMMNDDDELITAEAFLSTLAFNEVNTRLDRWVILEATKQLAVKREEQIDTRLIINLTANTLQDESLMPWLSVALKAGNLPPESITFQFLEADLINFLKPAISFSAALENMGCQLSIATFGNAEDPFKVLKQINAGFVKIAPDYTEQLQSDNDTQAIKDLISGAAGQDSKVIISNVENASSMALIWQLGVDYIQDSYLSTPLSSMEYEFTDIA